MPPLFGVMTGPLTPVTECNTPTPRASYFEHDCPTPQPRLNPRTDFLNLASITTSIGTSTVDMERTPSSSSLSRVSSSRSPTPVCMSHTLPTPKPAVHTPPPSSSSSDSSVRSDKPPYVLQQQLSQRASQHEHASHHSQGDTHAMAQSSTGLVADQGSQQRLATRPTVRVSTSKHKPPSTTRPASSGAAALSPTRIPVRATPAGAEQRRTGSRTPASATPIMSSPSARATWIEPDSEMAATSRSSPAGAYHRQQQHHPRAASALDIRSLAPRTPWRKASVELPPRPITSTDIRRRPKSVVLAPPPRAALQRPFSFHGLGPSLSITRSNSLVKSYDSKIDQLDKTLATLTSRKGITPHKDVRPPSRGRERRVSFQSMAQQNTLVDSEDRRRSSSSLARRPSYRISSLLSRFNKGSISSPLEVMAALPDMEPELMGTSPIRTAVRATGRFGVHGEDDAHDALSFTPHLQHHHQVTREGSIVEVAVARVLYAKNPDTHSDDESSAEMLDDQAEAHVSPGATMSPTLSSTTPSLSRSSSDAQASQTSSSSVVSPTMSPCSTVVYPLPSVAAPTDTRPDPNALLLLTANMLSSHAATLIRHAETMKEVSLAIRSMTEDGPEWGSLPSLEAALGLMNLGPAATHPLQSAPHPIASRPWAMDEGDLPALPPTVRTDRRRGRNMSLSLPPSSSGQVYLPSSLSLPSLPDALDEAERLSIDGWANLRAAQEAWSRAIQDLRRVPTDETLTRQRPMLDAGIQTSRPSSFHTAKVYSSEAPTPALPSRPSFATMIADGIELMPTAMDQLASEAEAAHPAETATSEEDNLVESDESVESVEAVGTMVEKLNTKPVEELDDSVPDLVEDRIPSPPQPELPSPPSTFESECAGHSHTPSMSTEEWSNISDSLANSHANIALPDSAANESKLKDHCHAGRGETATASLAETLAATTSSLDALVRASLEVLVRETDFSENHLSLPELPCDGSDVVDAELSAVVSNDGSVRRSRRSGPSAIPLRPAPPPPPPPLLADMKPRPAAPYRSASLKNANSKAAPHRPSIMSVGGTSSSSPRRWFGLKFRKDV